MMAEFGDLEEKQKKKSIQTQNIIGLDLKIV